MSKRRLRLSVRRYDYANAPTRRTMLRLARSKKAHFQVTLVITKETAATLVSLASLFGKCHGNQDRRLTKVCSFLVEEGLASVQSQTHRQNAFPEKEAKAMGLRIIHGRRGMAPHGKTPDGERPCTS